MANYIEMQGYGQGYAQWNPWGQGVSAGQQGQQPWDAQQPGYGGQGQQSWNVQQPWGVQQPWNAQQNIGSRDVWNIYEQSSASQGRQYVPVQWPDDPGRLISAPEAEPVPETAPELVESEKKPPSRAAGGDGPPGPGNALLQKYETYTETPVPGVEFGLYKMNPDGTANLIDTFITALDGQILASDLEPGDYYWQEIHPAQGYLPEIEDGQAKKYPFSVPTEDGEPVLVIAYNTRQYGNLTVDKTVVGADADPNREFTFTAVIGVKTEVFTLRHGQSSPLHTLPAGCFERYQIRSVSVADCGGGQTSRVRR